MCYMLIVHIVSLMILLESQIHVDKDGFLFNNESKKSRTKDAWDSVGIHTVTEKWFVSSSVLRYLQLMVLIISWVIMLLCMFMKIMS